MYLAGIIEICSMDIFEKMSKTRQKKKIANI
jgi:hypothetical protein